MQKRSGPRTDPLGTPILISRDEDVDNFDVRHIDRPLMYVQIHCRESYSVGSQSSFSRTFDKKHSNATGQKSDVDEGI